MKKTLFKWRIHCEEFGMNFRGGRLDIKCHLCGTHSDSELLSFTCRIVQQEILLKGFCYEDIFEEEVESELIKKIYEITSFRKNQLI